MNETGSLRVSPAGALLGELTVPGDKSVSHRAVMLGALAEEMVTVDGFGASADTLATIDAFRRMGVRIDHLEPGHLVIQGVGLRGLRPPDGPIDVGNAGTLIRLLPGILAGQQGEFVLDGDESIRSRPMQRIAVPLAEMGVDIQTTDGHPPVTVRGGGVQPIDYRPPVASAQVKSCVLLAGLHAERGVTVVEEPIPTRDHTERLLQRAGVPVDRRPGRVAVSPVRELVLPHVDVPGDFSSAAPFIVAATVLPGLEPDASRDRHQSDPHRPAGRDGAHGRPGRALPAALCRRRADRRHRGAAGRAGGRRCDRRDRALD